LYDLRLDAIACVRVYCIKKTGARVEAFQQFVFSEGWYEAAVNQALEWRMFLIFQHLKNERLINLQLIAKDVDVFNRAYMPI
jgi:hypothetical protein